MARCLSFCIWLLKSYCSVIQTVIKWTNNLFKKQGSVIEKYDTELSYFPSPMNNKILFLVLQIISVLIK